MSTTRPASESALLRFSLFMGIFFALLGVTWGLAIQSSVILFDGIYSGISIILTALSLLAADMLKRPYDDRFQFGRMAFEPMVIALKSVVIITVCLYGIVTASTEIIDGGASDTDSVGGIGYGLVSTIACLFSWGYLRRKGKGMPALVQAESEQWLLDTLLSTAVLVSFVISYVLSTTRHAALVPFIDPAMVILGSCFFIRTPLMRFYGSVTELLLAAPDDSVQNVLQDHAEAVASQHGFADFRVRSAKVGRELAVDLVFIADADLPPVRISALDDIRSEVQERLATLGMQLSLNILFTADQRWA